MSSVEWRISGTVRSADQAEELASFGVSAVDLGSDDVQAILDQASHLLLSAPPGPDGDPFVSLGLVLPRHLEWVGYLSTTGVYGDRDGGWVDEDSDLLPTGPRGQRRVLAEMQIRALCAARDVRFHTFRLAGIYGPGKNALRTVLDGKARRIDKPGQVFSRIHVEDIVRVLLASIERPEIDGAFNVCDDFADAPRGPIEFACDLLEVPRPPLLPFDEVELSAMARSFYDDNKRVKNERIKEELGVTLRYPDYKSGLESLLAEEIR